MRVACGETLGDWRLEPPPLMLLTLRVEADEEVGDLVLAWVSTWAVGSSDRSDRRVTWANKLMVNDPPTLERGRTNVTFSI